MNEWRKTKRQRDSEIQIVIVNENEMIESETLRGIPQAMISYSRDM